MKKRITNLLFLLVGIIIGLNIFNPYDSNRDGRINAQDYVVIKNYIMRGCDK